MNFPLSYIKGKNLYFAFFPHSAALLPEMCVCTLGHSVVSDCLRPYGLCSPPGSCVHGIFQSRIRHWVAISYSRRSSCSEMLVFKERGKKITST